MSGLRKAAAAVCVSILFTLCSCGSSGSSGAGTTEPAAGPGTDDTPRYEYSLSGARTAEAYDHSLAAEKKHFYVGGIQEVARYSAKWELEDRAQSLGDRFEKKISRITDIDVCSSGIFIAGEYLSSGKYKNLQIGRIDPRTMELIGSFLCDPESGLPDCAGLAADPDGKTIWICPYGREEDGGFFLYRFSADDGSFLGKTPLKDPPRNIQSITFHDGALYLAANDGDAEKNEPDHLYRTDPLKGDTFICEKAFDDIPEQGELGGAAFDEKHRKLLIIVEREGEFKDTGDYYPEQEHFSDIYIYDLR